jgi:DUF177 domain-containing protein
MRVNIDEIKDSGLDRNWEIASARLDEALRGDRAGYRAAGPAPVSAHLTRLGRRVLLEARTKVELGAPCGRCLLPAQVSVPVDFKLSLVPAEEAGGERATRHESPEEHAEGSFSPEQVDEETYTGKVIDLDPLVEEQIVLALPAYPVCREGCKGLCPVCGQNQNEKECGCDRRVPDPRWAGLEKFRQS